MSKAVVRLVQDYKNNVPLFMLAAKYEVPIHTIINVLHAVTTRDVTCKK